VDAATAHIESVAPDAAAKLQDVEFEIVDLPGNLLGLTVGDHVRIDVDAAGYGWFVEKDEGRRTKDEAVLPIPYSALRMTQSVDLLTVVMHELGHVLGLEHHDSGVMDDTLPLGTRRLPSDELDCFFTEAEIDALGSTPAANIEAIDEVFANQM
jgi:hypothetical protein